MLLRFGQLPVLFCVENNGYGLSTPTNEQYRCKDIADRGKGYGMESFVLDGNNIVEVYTKIQKLVESIRKRPRPILIEFKTFRMRGHEEASGTKYVPKKLMAEWSKKDPVENFKSFLIEQRVLTEKQDTAYKDAITNEINEHLQLAFDEAPIAPDMTTELNDIYKPFDFVETKPKSKTEELRLIDAIPKA